MFIVPQEEPEDCKDPVPTKHFSKAHTDGEHFYFYGTG